ncbi:phage holin family protein [Bacillus sp. mrc49]|uniref:phage holin family protein n=1 Tax=Bacillus sp. mrc49 TaxID=2054913 RepID=UPI000C27946F|nr:phage holin family protein [Bacillus sp. mrc49]PJN90603.1 hypothetical protein CVN76_09405 [Bacillus sp. mrc49]
MNYIKDFLTDLAAGLLFGGTAFLFGGWSTLLSFLALVLVIEILTGFYKGWYYEKLDSKIAYRGFMKKALIFIVIILAHILDVILGSEQTFGSEHTFRTAAILFYLGMEGISVLENLGAVGVKVPIFIKKRLIQLVESNDDKEA